MNRSEAIRRIVEEADRGELIFPTNLSASIKLQQALNDPGCHLETAARLVLAEPLIAARLVAIGNSVAYTRYGARIDNVRNAVNLLGFQTLRSLVAAIVVRQFSSAIAEPALREKSALLWQHCAHAAALAKVIAGHVGGLDPDTALFAGIVHEIGGFYLLSRAEAFPVLLDESALEADRTVDRELARGILRLLLVPRSVIEAVESLWDAAHAVPPVTLGDTLALANELSPVPSPLGLSAAGSIQPAALSECALQGKPLQAILEASASEIKSLTDMLLV